MSKIEDTYNITTSLIDTAGFCVGNYVSHAVSKDLPTPSVPKTLIFGVSDILIRNNTIKWWRDSNVFTGYGGNLSNNIYISAIAFLGMSLLDLAKGRKVGDIVKDNLILNAVGLASNEIIDRVIPSKFI